MFKLSRIISDQHNSDQHNPTAMVCPAMAASLPSMSLPVAASTLFISGATSTTTRMLVKALKEGFTPPI
ncbi:hypothetical protein [Photorhabdus namnaonensis]|uniref:hypothetical protein n=1 Tax=Photorhabdus namnaonensis TaxID=1851568 RepID=UPI0013F4C46B|nr:hypothetical protein [Photorhabdus namnaonensis]